ISSVPFVPTAAVYLPGDQPIAPWQLRAGWQPEVNGYREITPHATARLYQPEHMYDFEWDACATGPVRLRTFIEGQELPEIHFQRAECVHGKGRKEGQGVIVTLDFLVGPENKVRIGSFSITR